MRIITGTAKGVKLETLSGDDITRPTSDRVKEAIFSMLQFELADTRVLDLFGGSGQLALEALSRGAASAVICDANNDAVSVIKKNVAKTKFESQTRVFATDYKSLIRTFHSKEKFDIIFLDPPYAHKIIGDAIKRLTDADMVANGALIVCESDATTPVGVEGFEMRRFAKYGKSHITLLEYKPAGRETEAEDE